METLLVSVDATESKQFVSQIVLVMKTVRRVPVTPLNASLSASDLVESWRRKTIHSSPMELLAQTARKSGLV